MKLHVEGFICLVVCLTFLLPCAADDAKPDEEPPVRNRAVCGDCGPNQVCDASTGLCKCMPGYYGSTCAKCSATCLNGGVCDDGTDGSGDCKCPEGFYGPTCTKICTNLMNISCPNCNWVGGFCSCGICRCYSGWSGRLCNGRTFEDPCIPHTLNGCQTCLSQPGCGYCVDNTCFSLSGTYQCLSSVIEDKTDAACTSRIGHTESMRRGSATFGILIGVFAAVVLAIVTTPFVVKEHRPVFDHQTEFASGGVPCSYFRQERQVVRTAFEAPLEEHFIMAVPLKRISVEKLYADQSKRKRKNDLQ